MKPIYLVYLFTAALLYTACKKDKSVTPAPVVTKTDSTVVIPAGYTPYTDTFYGQAQETFTINYNALEYVYVGHPTADSITFSSNNNTDYTKAPIFNGAFMVDSASYYQTGSGVTYNKYRLKGDSLLYSSSSGGCADPYIVNYAGVRVSKPH